MSKFFERNSDRLSEDVRITTTLSSRPSSAAGRQRLTNAATIDVDRIEADPQHREHFDETRLQELADSMKQHGQLQPARVRWDDARAKYVIIAGERRYRAALLAELPSLDCIVVEGDISDARILREQIIENAKREDLKPTEKARSLRDLMELEGLNGKQLAETVNEDASVVSRMLKLLQLPEDVQTKVDAGAIGIREAVRCLEKTSSMKKPERLNRKKGSKEKKVRTTAGTLTLKSRRTMSDQLWLTALREALAAAETEQSEETAQAA